MPDDPEKPQLQPAETNPWYVLMTVAGPQTGESRLEIDDDLHARNRRFWNGWAAQALSDDDKATLIAKGRATEEDLAPLTDAEQAEIAAALTDRGPTPKVGNQKSAPFTGPADFESATFTEDANFRSATFSGPADFESATFTGPAYFESATFSGPADFQSATFSRPADFQSATFSRPADFQSATFSGPADFQSATFSGDADFESATFSGPADFQSATFSRPADFQSATFSRPADFQSATFSGPADFSDATFKAATMLRAARFLREPPAFFNADLHEDTDFTDVAWPAAPDDDDQKERRSRAIAHRRAYERLKLLMDSQKKVADELMFQRLELRCREAEAPGAVRALQWLGVRCARLLGWRKAGPCRRFEKKAASDTRDWAVARTSRAFGALSDYGWDPVRPLAWLLALVVPGWLPIFAAEMVAYLWLDWPDCNTWAKMLDACPKPEYLGIGQSFAVSLSNVFGFLGLGRTFLREEIVTLTTVSEIVSVAQTICGLVLFFLLALTLRNRFRIK